MPSIFTPQTPVTNDTGAVTLGFEGAPNVLYDRTMVGATTYTISTTGTTGGETMSIVLRGAHAYSFASSVAINWALFSPPVPQCSATAFDKIAFEVLMDGSLLGFPQAMGAGAAALTVTAFVDSIYAGASMTVGGTYFGTAPTNLDYSMDDAAYVTLGAGAATITNGSFNFEITAPAAGKHTITVRATGTSEVSPAQSFTTSAEPSISTPSAIFGSNLEAWWEAGSITGLTTGESVTTWADQSGNGYTATGGIPGYYAAPTYTSSGLGGTPSVVFNGVQGMSTNLTADTVNRAVFAVFNLTGEPSSEGNASLYGASGTGGFQVGINPSLTVSIISQYVADVGTSSGTVAANTVQFLMASYAAGETLFNINGTAAGSGTSTQTMTSSATWLGNFSSGSNGGFTGEIKEIFSINETPTSAQISAVNAYFQSKYGSGV